MNTPNLKPTDLEALLHGIIDYQNLEEKYNRLRVQLSTFAGLVKTQFDALKQNGIKFEHEFKLTQLLRDENLNITVVNGVANFTDYREKVVEVPIQDSRTKHLIHMLAVQMRKYFEKYPKLRDECD